MHVPRYKCTFPITDINKGKQGLNQWFFCSIYFKIGKEETYLLFGEQFDADEQFKILDRDNNGTVRCSI